MNRKSMNPTPRIVVAVDIDHHSVNAFNWVRDDPLAIMQEETLIEFVHVVKEERDRHRGIDVLSKWGTLARKTFKDRNHIKISTKLLEDKQGVGHAIKRYCNEIKPKTLVVASCKTTALKRHLLGSVSEYCQHHCQCPVVIVKKPRVDVDVKVDAQPKPLHVAIAIDSNVHSDHAVEWFLSQVNLPKKSTMVLLHVVQKPKQKPDARKFLASYRPRCLESKKDFTMKSGLVYFKGKKPSDSILKYANDYGADLLIVASKWMTRFARQFKGSVSDACVKNAECDVMVWKDERTRRLSTEGSATPPNKKDLEKEDTGLGEYDVAMMEMAYSGAGYEKLEPPSPADR